MQLGFAQAPGVGFGGSNHAYSLLLGSLASLPPHLPWYTCLQLLWNEDLTLHGEWRQPAAVFAKQDCLSKTIQYSFVGWASAPLGSGLCPCNVLVRQRAAHLLKLSFSRPGKHLSMSLSLPLMHHICASPAVILTGLLWPGQESLLESNAQRGCWFHFLLKEAVPWCPSLCGSRWLLHLQIRWVKAIVPFFSTDALVFHPQTSV